MSSVLLFNKDGFLALIKSSVRHKVASFVFVAVGRGGS